MDDMIEAMAKAIHDHWQGAPSSAARSWEETCQKLSGQAEDFRRKARAALDAVRPTITRDTLHQAAQVADAAAEEWSRQADQHLPDSLSRSRMKARARACQDVANDIRDIARRAQ